MFVLLMPSGLSHLSYIGFANYKQEMHVQKVFCKNIMGFVCRERLTVVLDENATI